MNPSFLSVTPMIPTGGSMADVLTFFRDSLGFTIGWEAGTMAGVRRGGVAFNLVQNSNREWAENASFSIAVDDLDAIHAEYRAVPAKVGPLELKSWGRREFHMILPSGVCLQFYQANDG